ncbi:hypothetical protein ASE93_23325 [Serratia sp. Leaf50]|nr:hypothetical protein ASE93_23325 [Serratia sp. Leaf50]
MSDKSHQNLIDFILSGVSLETSEYQGRSALKMQMPFSAFQDPAKEKLTDRKFMAWLPLDFHNGTIDVEVASTLADDAPAYARGFLGISFRIDNQQRFENIYLRPTNSQADDQIRRNHSVQYFAYPDYPFERLRAESPEQYETYADIAPEQWITMKIVVSGHTARLFLNFQAKPALIVNELKLGTETRGGVGIWIESGTVAFFRKLTVSSAMQ